MQHGKILKYYEKTIPLTKIKKILLSPGIDGHFASIFSKPKVLMNSKNFQIVKKVKGFDRITLKFNFFKNKKLYLILNKKKNKLLNMIKKNDVSFPIVKLIQKSKKKVSIICV